MEYKFAPAFISKDFAHIYDAAVNLVGVGDSLHAKILKVKKLKGTEKVLDVGAGTGTLAVLLKETYPKLEVTAVDPDDQILAIAKKKADKRKCDITLVQSGAEKLPFKESSFDIIYSTLTFHHLPLEIKHLALEEIHRVLKPKGQFILVDIGKPKNSIWKFLLHIESIVETNAYMKDNLEGNIPKFMLQHGFTVTECLQPHMGNRFLIGNKKKK